MLYPRRLANYVFHSALLTVLWKRSQRRANLPRSGGRSKAFGLIANGGGADTLDEGQGVPGGVRASAIGGR